MAKIRNNQTNFTAGEISPRLYGRTDLNKYKNSCRTLENFIVTPHGGVRRRPGTEWIANVKTAADNTKLIPFQFNNIDTYMIEAGDYYFRFYRNDAQITKAGTPDTFYNTSSTTFVTWPVNWDELVTFEDTLDISASDDSNGTGSTAGSDQETAVLIGAGGGNEARWVLPLGNAAGGRAVYAIYADIDSDVDYQIGTTAGASDVATGTASAGSDVLIYENGGSSHFLTLQNANSDTRNVTNIQVTHGADTVVAAPWNNKSSGTGALDQGITSGDIYKILDGGASGIARIDMEFKVDLVPGNYDITIDIGRVVGAVKYHITGTTLDYFASTAELELGNITSGTLTAGEDRQIVHAVDSAYEYIVVSFYNEDNDSKGIGVISVSQTASTSGAYEIATPWSKTEIDDLRWTQSHDTMFFVHPDHKPRKLVRSDHDDWNFETFSTLDGPWLEPRRIAYTGRQFPTATEFTPAAVTGQTTMTKDTAFSTDDVFTTEDVGRLIRWREDNAKAWGYAIVTSFVSATVVNIDWILAPSGSAATGSSEWHMSAWSDRSDIGYPTQIEFHEQRLFFSSSAGQPLTIWGSRSGAFDDFSPDNDSNLDEVDDDTAVNFTIASNKGGAIEWMSAQKSLFLGTTVSIHNMKASTQQEAITPSNINITKETSVSVKDAQQVDTDNSVIFINRYGRRVHELAYSFEADAFQAPDLTILSEHLTYPGTSKIVRQEHPDNVIWLTTQTDGNLRSLTFLREQEVVGWARHTLGGTDVVVKDIQVIPDSNEAQLWLIVERTVNSVTVQTIEILKPKFDQADSEDAFFVDSGVTYSGGSTSTITGLDHLEGETVVALNNGVVETGLTVSSGSVTLGSATTKCHVGLAYDSILETNSLEPENPAGTSQGKLARVTSAIIRVIETLGGKMGYSSGDTLDSFQYNLDDTPLDSNNVRNGDVKVHMPKGYERNARLYIKFDEPTPATIDSIITTLEVGGE